MIKFEHTDIVGFEHAIRGMRNPLESWAKSDSVFIDSEGDWYTLSGDSGPFENVDGFTSDGEQVYVGPNDLDLMTRLRNAGTDHRKFMRMITVYVDITAPLYWWKEFDTYKVGTVANSCSTMHKIHAKEFTLEDFSNEHLMGFDNSNYWEEDDDNACFIENKVISIKNTGVTERRQVIVPMYMLENFIIPMLNTARQKYLETKSKPMKNEKARQELMKKYWWQMIQLLPSSYNQKRTVMLNYEVLANIYKSRKNHKLDEWSEGFTGWIKGLPYSELITAEKE